MRTLARIIFALALCGAFLTLPACNTTKGFGKDIERTGESIKDSADRNGAD